MAEPTEMLFGVQSRVSPRSMY